MPVYRLVNTAIDGVANDPQAVLEDILRFSSSDLLCYRADAPDTLVRAPERGLGPGHRLGAGDARRTLPARRGRHPCRAAARGDRRASASISASAPSRSGWRRCM